MRNVKRQRVSLRKSINNKCRDCIYDPLAGGSWLKQVEMCTSTDCPLYPVRPMPHKSNVKISSVKVPK